MPAEFNFNELMENLELDMEGSIESFEKQLAVLRTGRATPAILDVVKVDYYGTPTPLNQVGSISVVEGQTLIVKPYDATILGINPANDGKVLRLVVPSMTEDKRKKLANEVSQLAEKAKTVIRNLRRDVNKLVETAQKDKLISEDNSHQYKENVQEQLKTYENKIISIEKKKVDEILKF